MGGIILVVEDDAALRQLATESVSMTTDIPVKACATADEALVCLQTGEQVILVFSDVHMPGTLNGLDLAHLICNEWPGVPVVLTSGDPVIAAGALPQNTLFLPKPWGLASLHQVISKCVPQSSATVSPNDDQA